MPYRKAGWGQNPSQRYRRGREVHSEVQSGSGVPAGGPGEVGRPTLRFGMPNRRFGKVRRPIRGDGRGREAHPEAREGSL